MGVWVYTPGNSVKFDFNLPDKWKAEAGNDVSLNFTNSLICSSDAWEAHASLDFVEPWSSQTPSEVTINFHYSPCGDPACPDDTWEVAVPNAIPIIIQSQWEDYPADHVEIDFVASICQGPADYLSFTGFFIASSDEEVNVAVQSEYHFGPTARSGENSSVDVQKSAVLAPVATSGESVSNTPITFYPSQGLGTISATDGDSSSAAVSMTVGLDASSESGSSSVANVAISASISAAGESGETATADVDARVPWAANPIAYSGERAEASVSTSSVMGQCPAYAGENTHLDVEAHPAAHPEGVAYTGETATVAVVGQTVFTLRVNSGEQVSVDVTTAESSSLLPLAYDDQSATLSVAFSQSVGTINSYDGSSVSCVIDIDSLFIGGSGEYATCSIASAIVVGSEQYSGESTSVDVDVHPSEPVGVLLATSGEATWCVLSTLISAIVYLNPVTQWDDAVVFLDTSTYFDLQNQSCIPPQSRDSYTHIELSAAEPVDILFTEEKIIATCSVSTRTRFHPQSYTGESSGYFTYELPTMQAFQAESACIVDIQFEELNIPLCYGNLIPVSESTNIEMVDLSSYLCSTDMMYSGETATVDICANVRFYPAVMDGETSTTDVFCIPALRFLAYSGESARDIGVWIRCYGTSAETASCQIAGEEYLASSGEAATVSVTTLYDVEFLERGCLDNEFVPSNENGDADWDKFNPVPVELDFFVHSIKGRCM